MLTLCSKIGGVSAELLQEVHAQHFVVRINWGVLKVGF